MIIRGGMTGVSSVERYEESSLIPNESATSYNLIWSPGFASKFAAMTLALLLLHLTRLDTQIGGFITDSCFRFAEPLQGSLSMGSNYILPLLSSSCCLLQLLINIFVGSSGCAGFNTILGPYRPYLLSFLAFLNLISRPRLGRALLRGSIAFLPEAVHFWNRLRSSQWRKNHGTNVDPKSTGLIRATIHVDIPTMGCTACINKIESSLRKCAPDYVVGATSWLDPNRPKGGLAKVETAMESEDDVNSLTETIMQAIKGAGFGGSKISAVEIKNV